jgi:regulator of protease activity HflC (stomatin/prohibitin superfamily)
MDPNKFISPVVQQGMQSEASRYTADAGAAASRFTAQSAAAAKADDRALKARLEGPKAAQEAMLARMLAQAGGDIEKISEISAAYKGTPGAAYSVTQDLNGGVPYVTPQRGMLKGTPLKGGVRAEFERNMGAELSAKLNSFKTSGEKEQFENSLEEYQKQLIQNYIDSKKAK